MGWCHKVASKAKKSIMPHFFSGENRFVPDCGLYDIWLNITGPEVQ
jgi:hypothetical protein